MGRRGSEGLGQVGGALSAALTRLGLAGQLAQYRALVVWPEVVGAQIAAVARAVAVRDGILFVATKSSTWAHELILRKRTILAGLEERLGEGVITDVRFQVRGYTEATESATTDRWALPDETEWVRAPLTERDREVLQTTLEPVSDPVLRVRLEKVLADSLRIRRWKEEHGWLRCTACGLPHRGESRLCAICRPRR